MSSKKTVIFTGGGSGGHVMPGLTLIKELGKDPHYSLAYIGGKFGIERELLKSYSLPYYPISTGKLRRYLSFENLKDVFKVILGIFQSIFILLKFPKDTLIFSTGGFVTVPVVLAAVLTRRKVYLHEQTTRAGLANRISGYFAQKIFLSFEESLNFFPKDKSKVTGYPVRAEFFEKEVHPVMIEGHNLNEKNLPILLITGGGNGSLLINEFIEKHLDELKKEYFIVHQVGKKFVNKFKKYNDENYVAVSFIDQNMADLFKVSKFIIGRSGAGTVCELMSLRKPSIFIPLKIAQKNEQLFNAKEAQKELGSQIILEDDVQNINLPDFLKRIEWQETVVLSENSLNGTKKLIQEIQSAFQM